MKKKLIIAVQIIIVLSIVSCTKDIVFSENPINDMTEIDRLSFASKADFEMAMANIVNGATKGLETPTLKAGLVNRALHVDIENDPILSYDLRNANFTKAGSDESVYVCAGYDTLIPDKNLANFLNVRAEIEIGNVIYKISPKGTYYFDKSLEDDFNNNYASFEESEGITIDSLTVQVKEGIFRYATFASDSCISFKSETYYEEGECEDKNDQEKSLETKATNSALKKLNYKNYPRYCTNATTWIGKIFQSIFGSNKSYEYWFSNRSRFSSKFYYYDYVFYASIGAQTTMQRRPFLFWREDSAEEIYIGWGDIVTFTDVDVNPEEYAARVKDGPKAKIKGQVAYIFGLYETQEDIDEIVNKGVSTLLTEVKNRTKVDVSSVKQLFVLGPEGYHTIYRPDGISRENVAVSSMQFYKEFTLSLSMSETSFAEHWSTWLLNVLWNTFTMPNTRLVQGEVRTAVKYDGQIGAMSIYKE